VIWLCGRIGAGFLLWAAFFAVRSMKSCAPEGSDDFQLAANRLSRTSEGGILGELPWGGRSRGEGRTWLARLHGRKFPVPRWMICAISHQRL